MGAIRLNGETLSSCRLTRSLPRWWPAAVVILVIAIVVGWGPCDHFMLTGRFFPVDQIETLHSARPVAGWTAETLLLTDGTRVPLPGLTKLPQASIALEAAVAQGVEIAPNGEVYGLLRIHHWCGCDPVRHHIAKINLARLLRSIGEGEPECKALDDWFRERPRFQYSGFGWDVAGWMQFRQFETHLADQAAEPQ